MEKGHERSVYFDLLRLIAMFMVIGVHAVGSIVEYSGKYSVLCNRILTPLNNLGVPIFFAISGFFLLESNIQEFGKWYIRKLKRLGIPYLLFAVLYVSYFVGFEQHNYLGIPLAYIKDILCAEVHGTHWFVYAIIGLYIVTPFLNRMFHHCTDMEIIYLFISCLVVQLLQEGFSLFGWRFGITNIVFNLDYLCFFIWGYCSRRILSQISTKYLGNMRWLILGVFLVMYVMYPSKILVLLILSCLFMKAERLRLPVFLRQFLQMICQHSYSIYLVHAAVLSLILRMYNEWRNFFLFKLFLLYFGVCGISLLIVYIPDRIMDKLFFENNNHTPDSK